MTPKTKTPTEPVTVPAGELAAEPGSDPFAPYAMEASPDDAARVLQVIEGLASEMERLGNEAKSKGQSAPHARDRFAADRVYDTWHQAAEMVRSLVEPNPDVEPNV